MFIILLSFGHSDSKLMKNENKDIVLKNKPVEIIEDSIRSISKDANVDSISKNKAIIKNANPNEWPYPMPSDFTPLTFIKTFSTYNNSYPWDNYITISGIEFPDDWVKRADIDTLLTLIESTQKCKCVVSVLSSNIPDDNATNIGGYAIKFINSYRNKSKYKFGTYDCPKTDAKSVEEINRWWAKYRQEK